MGRERSQKMIPAPGSEKACELPESISVVTDSRQGERHFCGGTNIARRIAWRKWENLLP